MVSFRNKHITDFIYGIILSIAEQKKVDAQETPLSLMYSSKFYEVQDYLTLTGHTYSPWPVVINKEFYTSLPKELQTVIMDAAVETTGVQSTAIQTR